jgi:hypothetical protein
MFCTHPLFLAVAPVLKLSLSSALSRGARDPWTLFGFVAAAILLGSFVIRRRSIALLVVRAGCAAAMAVYGFESAAWPLGMLLSVVCARHGYELGRLILPATGKWPHRPASRFPLDSRITRMFDVGSSLADWDANPTRPKSPHDLPPPEGAMN